MEELLVMELAAPLIQEQMFDPQLKVLMARQLVSELQSFTAESMAWYCTDPP